MGVPLDIDISQKDFQDLLDFADTSIRDPKDFDLVIRFQSDYGQSKMIRDLILKLFERNNIDVPWKNRFALISDELVNNSIEYGSMPLDKNTLTIKFRPVDGKLFVNLEVRDTGRGPEAKTSKEMEEIRRMKEAQGFDGYLGKRGRGLFQMIANIVDELYFADDKSGGLIVGIRKTLEYQK
jgi:anti-sigma regulatory factor (Ser/Thr protein kinase)